MALMTKAQYAKHRGVTPQAISKLVKNDRVLVTEDGLIDSDISDVLLAEFSDQDSTTSQLANKLSGIDSYARQRTILTQYKAELAKIELDKAKGMVVDADQVRRAAFDTARRVRDTILNLPDRIAPLVATADGVHAIRTLLDTELRKALLELYNEFIPAEGNA